MAGGGIVVGVDGSEGSQGALRWALDEAALRGTRVVAICAWEAPIVTAGPGMMPMPVPEDDLEASAEQRLRHVVAEVQGGMGGTVPVELEHRVLRGSPAGVLLDEAQNADLVVLGSRGHGGFVGLLLGSVSQQVVHHAPCPVVVVPHDR